MSKYDYLIVGAGLFGAVAAYRAARSGKKALVIDRRPHTGGNAYCEEREGIRVHKYGAHIFHTSNREVWEFVNRFVEFNNYINSPVANYKGKLYNLPFNMNTFYAMWGVTTPAQAAEMIDRQRHEAGISQPRNLEEQAIALVGIDIYERLVKGYTEKQWGRDATQLPAFIIKRLPVRFTFDNNYFRDRFQGIPEEGYTSMVEKMLEGIEVLLNTDFLKQKDEFEAVADKVIFTGPIDAYFDYVHGALNYRSVRFETEILPISNYQGVAVVNYNEREVPFTRIIEHKHFAFGTQEKTVISREYPSEWQLGVEPYYPVNDAQNTALYERYKALADQQDKVRFAGRLGQYKYFDMDKVIAEALTFVHTEFSE